MKVEFKKAPPKNTLDEFYSLQYFKWDTSNNLYVKIVDEVYLVDERCLTYVGQAEDYDLDAKVTPATITNIQAEIDD